MAYAAYEPTVHDLDRHEQVRGILGRRDAEETARALKVDRNTYSKKLGGKRGWTQRDCDRIAQLTGRVIKHRRI